MAIGKLKSNVNFVIDGEWEIVKIHSSVFCSYKIGFCGGEKMSLKNSSTHALVGLVRFV